MKLNDKINIASSAIVGGLVIFALEEFGISQEVMDYQIYKAFYSETFREINLALAPVSRIVWDSAAGILAGGTAFAILNYDKFRKS